MNADGWKEELHRFWELIEHESTMSLKKVKHIFKATGHPFNGDFRKYFLKISTLRLETSFDTVLFDRLDEKQLEMPMPPNISNDTNREVYLDVSTSTSILQLMAGEDDDDRVEIVVSNAEDKDSADEQQKEATNHIATEDRHLDSNAFFLESRNADNFNRDGVHSGIDVNNANDIEVYVKRELKIENEDGEPEDLPLVEFDPTKDYCSSHVENYSEEAGTMIVQRKSSSSSNAKKQSNTGKLFECQHCDYASRSKFNVKQHQLIHAGIKPFKCDHCEYASRTKGNFKRHQRIHDGQKLMGIARDCKDGTYKCPQCDRQFSELKYLSNHVTILHKNNQRLFNCLRCLRSFARKTEKDRHEIRCKIRHYECFLCKKYFARDVIDMQEHMRTHSGAKPFKCAICKKYFRIKCTLERHLKDIHSRA